MEVIGFYDAPAPLDSGKESHEPAAYKAEAGWALGRDVCKKNACGWNRTFILCRRVTPTHVILFATGSWLMCTWCMRFLTASLFKLLGLRLLQQCWWALQSSGCDAMYLRRLVYRYESFERACCLRLWRHSRRRTAVKMEAANLPKRWRPYTCLHHVELE
jgi:hypothetical protein